MSEKTKSETFTREEFDAAKRIAPFGDELSYDMIGEKVKFRQMKQGDRDDYKIIMANSIEFVAGVSDRIIALLERMREDETAVGGFQIDRFEHCLQTATFAHQAGEDEEYVVCALIHDVGDGIATFNHADLAAAILKPYVSEENHWMIEKHDIFQGYYFHHYLGFDRNKRDAYRDHPHFKACARFCEKYDQAAFDPTKEIMPLSAFEPMIRRVFERPKHIPTMEG